MTLNKILAPVALAAAMAVPSLSQAQGVRPLPDGTTVFSPMVGLAFTGGGKTLKSVQYQDGSTQDIKSGGLAFFYLGGEFRWVGSPMALQGLVGYHYDTTAANNGNVRFSRVPVEVTGMFNPAERFRVGAGLHYDTNLQLTGSGAGASSDLPVKYRNAAGFVIKGEWMAFQEVGLELSYVGVRYKPDLASSAPGTDPATVDGSHFGIGFNYHW